MPSGLVNHGALILEPIYKKEGDFAMEFTPTVGGRYCLAATRILLRMRKVFIVVICWFLMRKWNSGFYGISL